MLGDTTTEVEPRKIAASIDPPGGGRDVAGVIGGFLGADKRVWVTDDVSAPMSSAEWSTAACRLAYRINASVIQVEWNFGRDMRVRAISTSWETLQRVGETLEGVLMPAIHPVRAKQGALLCWPKRSGWAADLGESHRDQSTSNRMQLPLTGTGDTSEQVTTGMASSSRSWAQIGSH